MFLSLYDRTPVHAARTEADFLPTLRSGKRRPYRILRAGKTVGYLCADSGLDAVSELELEDPAFLPHALHAFFNEVGRSSLLLYGIAPAETGKLALLLPIATAAKLSGRERYRIFDYRGLIEAGLRARAEHFPLLPGTVRFAVEGYGTLTVTVDGTVQVTRTEEIAGTVLTGEEATRLLLGLPSPCGSPSRLRRGSRCRSTTARATGSEGAGNQSLKQKRRTNHAEQFIGSGSRTPPDCGTPRCIGRKYPVQHAGGV